MSVALPLDALVPTIKRSIVSLLARVPSLKAQRALAAFVRAIWPGFPNA